MKTVVKVAVFAGSIRFHMAASQCSAYVMGGDALSSQLKFLWHLFVCPVGGLLAAKHLLAEASKESGRYVFRFLEI